MISFAAFDATAKVEGADEVLEREYGPNVVIDTHTHSFAVKALVVRGEFWLTCGNDVRRLQPGDRFELGYEEPHSERYGPEGATFWVARRNSRA